MEGTNTSSRLRNVFFQLQHLFAWCTYIHVKSKPAMLQELYITKTFNYQIHVQFRSITMFQFEIIYSYTMMGNLINTV